MPIANVDQRLPGLLKRATELEKQRREAMADLKDLRTEMQNASPEFTQAQISGVFIAAQRECDTNEQTEKREARRLKRAAAEEVADDLSALPLFSAVA